MNIIIDKITRRVDLISKKRLARKEKIAPHVDQFFPQTDQSQTKKHLVQTETISPNMDQIFLKLDQSQIHTQQDIYKVEPPLTKQNGHSIPKSESSVTQNGQNNLQTEQPLSQAESIAKSDAQIVSSLIKKSNRILTTASTHKIPVDFFPDTINVEESRVTIIRREFFLSSRVHSVDIKDISNIFINTSPLRAQLVIVSNTYTKNDIRIKNLRIKQAIYIRRIIEGLRTFETSQIDTSVYTKAELIAKLESLSKTDIVV